MPRHDMKHQPFSCSGSLRDLSSDLHCEGGGCNESLRRCSVIAHTLNAPMRRGFKAGVQGTAARCCPTSWQPSVMYGWWKVPLLMYPFHGAVRASAPGTHQVVPGHTPNSQTWSSTYEHWRCSTGSRRGERPAQRRAPHGARNPRWKDLVAA